MAYLFKLLKSYGPNSLSYRQEYARVNNISIDDVPNGIVTTSETVEKWGSTFPATIEFAWLIEHAEKQRTASRKVIIPTL